MERRRKYSRHFLHSMQTLSVLLVIPISILVIFCSFVQYANCIMAFPDERSGVYSLFPNEDLKTGRKTFRFDEETSRNYRDGRAEYSGIVRSYPMLPHDRFHRPDYAGSRQVYDNYRDRDYRDRQSRVYFDDNFRSSRFDFRQPPPRPRPIETPVNPIIFETSRPHNHYSPDRFPPPAVGQSKLPIGAAVRASGEDIPTRIHIFNPESNSFGNPRNAGGSSGGTSSERTKGPPSNFIETGPPGPESFLNHEEFLEYQKKIAFARFHEQDGSGNNDGGSSAGSNSGKKVLFESKEPFQIDGLVPPDKSEENSGKLSTSSGKVTQQQTPGKSQREPQQQHHQHQQIHQIHDQRQLQRQGEGQKVRTSGASNQPRHREGNDGEEERDTGGGEVESRGVNEKGEEEESENGKSEVTQLPPTHITKSGRSHSSSGSVSAQNSRITPSISFDDDQVGGTGFRLPVPSTTVSYSRNDDDEPPNLNGFVPVVPFHLIGPEQPRSISLERQRQQQQHHIIPHPPEYSTTTATTTTAKSIPVRTTISTTTSRTKVDKSGFRPPEVTKSFSSSSTGGDESTSIAGNGNAGGDDVTTVNKGFSSPASPILHATAGERSNSETHSKVAITKQQELKRLQKQRQLTHQLTIPANQPGLFPDIGFGDSSASSDSADNSDNNPGTYNSNTNDYIEGDTSGKTYLPHYPEPTEDTLSASTSLPPTDFDLSPSPSSPQQEHNPETDSQPETKNTFESDDDNSHNQYDDSHTSNILDHNDEHSENTNNSSTDHSNIHNPDSYSETSQDTEIKDHSSVTSGDENETIKSSSIDDTNNEMFDTRAVHTANGIKQGEFHLEGYMMNSIGGGEGGSTSSSRSSVNRADDYSNNEESVVNQLNHLHRNYDYPDDYLPRVGTSSPIMPDNPLSPVIIPEAQLPGTMTPDLQQQPEHEQDLTPPAELNPSPYQNSTNTDSTHGHQDDDVTGNEYFSRSDEPTIEQSGAGAMMSIMMGNPVGAFESEPTPPDEQLRTTRLSENNENSFVPTNLYSSSSSITNNEDRIGSSYVENGNFNNKINSRSRSSSSSSSSSDRINGEDDGISSGSTSSSEYLDENGAFEHDDLNLLGKAFRYGSYVNGKRKQMRNNKKPKKNKLLESSKDGLNSIFPSSISVPVQATLISGLDVPDYGSLSGSIRNNDVSGFSYNYNVGIDDDQKYNNAPLFLESSETLINKTYYFDGNSTFKNGSNNSAKFYNFIKVTRIKAPSGPSSTETADKTSSAIMARRTSKPAVIVSEIAEGSRPTVIGSVVEAGPAWPGLVSNFLRTTNINNRTFIATATVRPRGSSGTNPTHPTNVISSQVQQQAIKVNQQLKPSPIPTQFQLQQIRHHQSVTKSIDGVNRPSNDNSRNSRNLVIHGNMASNSSIRNSGNFIIKAVNTKLLNESNHNSSMDATAHVISRRLYSSEEDSSSVQNRSTSSTGVVSMVHAHISHCPKLHSPTEVICDVHIREGHGVPNPQLTVGWRRKFYNSTLPDVLLAVNKAPASGEHGQFDPHHSILEVEPGKSEKLEEFHDKFNVTLAPGISPMLRSVLLIRSVTAPDCGTYQCEVSDGINVLKSETLLFLCH